MPSSAPFGIALLTAMAMGRASLIAVFAVGVSGPLAQWLRGPNGRACVVAWILVVAPFFTPSLLVSYAFSKLALSLIVSAWSHEALYAGVLALKFVPVAVVLRTLLPSPLSAEGWHTFRMLGPHRWMANARFRIHAMGQGPWIVGALVFLLAFADFELASLWSVKTWTMAVFDAQVGGYALGGTLHLAAGPLAVQLCLLAALYLAGRHAAPAISAHGGDADAHHICHPGIATACWIYAAVSAVCVSLVPLLLVAGQALAGVSSLIENFVLGGELMASVAFASAAAVAAAVCVFFVRRSRLLAAFLCLPGLLGPLIVSLLLLALFQAPGFRFFYDTPLPLGVALTMLLLPLALLLAALWLQPTSASHIARQLRSRRLIWELETRLRAVVIGILFCWAYFDFTASTILAPTGFTPVFARLHNLAHYGQTAVLSAMMLVAFATPILVLLLTGTAWRLYARGHGR